MSRIARLALGMVVVTTLVLGSVASTAAGGPKVLDSSLTGIPTAGLVLHGLTGGGVPWVIDEGRAKLFADGRLQVDVEGLVLASNGTNPIPNGRAIVTCNSVRAASSQIVPFSATGDAEVTAVVELPDPCLAPAVFFVGVLASGAEPWFAVTGF
jgi:hypothetical protein